MYFLLNRNILWSWFYWCLNMRRDKKERELREQSEKEKQRLKDLEDEKLREQEEESADEEMYDIFKFGWYYLINIDVPLWKILLVLIFLIYFWLLIWNCYYCIQVWSMVYIQIVVYIQSFYCTCRLFYQLIWAHFLIILLLFNKKCEFYILRMVINVSKMLIIFGRWTKRWRN